MKDAARARTSWGSLFAMICGFHVVFIDPRVVIASTPRTLKNWILNIMAWAPSSSEKIEPWTTHKVKAPTTS